MDTYAYMSLESRSLGWRIPDDLWNEMKPLLPPGKRHPLGCHNPRVDDRKAMDAIFFVLRTGCQWAALDETGICKHSSAHRRFLEWTEAGVFRELWRRGLLAYDEFSGINWDWQSMDGAMTKAPLGGEDVGPNPTDRAKKGTKRSILTDGAGVPIGIVVAGANRVDFKMARETILSIPIDRPRATRSTPQGMCLDKGYDFDEIRSLLHEFRFTPHIRARGEEAKAITSPGMKARRWVVERAHSWMNRFRRILVRWEKKTETYLAMVHFSLGLIAWRAAGLLL
jgi:transposase